MRTLMRCVIALVAFAVLLLPSCVGDDPKPSGNGDIFTDQAICRGRLASDPNSSDRFDVFIDVVVVDTYTVAVEGGGTNWNVLSGTFEDALRAAYLQAKSVGLPVRIVYGPGLTDALEQFDASVRSQSFFDVKRTYYATLADGCTEAAPRLHHPTGDDCIIEGASECRVRLIDACADPTKATDGGEDVFLDLAFAWWNKEVDAGPGETCYGVFATGPYAISLPSSDFCQCGTGGNTPADVYPRARDLLDAVLELRGFDQATAFALASGMASAALAKQDTAKE